MKKVSLVNKQPEAIQRIFGEGSLLEDEYVDEDLRGAVGVYNEGKRSSHVTLPTGGGKSYVAMRVIQEMIERHPEVDLEKSEGVISNLEIGYLAPNTGILHQFKIHMAENMIFEHYNEQYENQIDESNVESIAKSILGQMLGSKISSNIDFDESVVKAREKLQNEGKLNPKNLVKEIVKVNIKNLDENDLTKVVKRAFPNMDFGCYQKIRKEMDGKKLYILDEAHRGGAEKWGKELEKLVDRNKDNGFFLTITATPERDSDDKSMIRTIALKTGYTSDEYLAKKNEAVNYGLLEAIINKDVVEPKVVSFPCNLDETKEYKEVLATLKDFESKGYKDQRSKSTYQLTAKGEKFEAMQFVMDEMNRIVGRQKGESDEQWQYRKAQMIQEIINNNGYNSNGKYVTFIPDSSFVDPQIGAEETKKEERLRVRALENIRIHLNKMKSILGVDKIRNYEYHGSVHDDDTCTKFLGQFEAEDSFSGGVKSIMTCSKLTEGVHVEDVDGEFLFAEIRKSDKPKEGEQSPRIKLLQQMGRCIRANLGEGQKEPVIFDYANNILRNFDAFVIEGEPVLDLDESQIKAKAFFDLYELSKLITRNKPSLVSMYEIQNKETGERKKTFHFSDGTKVYYPPDKPLVVAKENSSDKFQKTVELLRILKGVNPPIDLKALPPDTVIDDDFFKKFNILESIKSQIVGKGIITREKPNFDLGKSLTHIKRVFFGLETDASLRTVLSRVKFEPPADETKKEYLLSELAELGVIYLNKEERMNPDFAGVIDINGFIKPNLALLNSTKIDEGLSDEVKRKNAIDRIEFLNKFVGINVNTGTKYYFHRDEYGCFEPGTKDKDGRDIGGFDLYGYDKYGFDRNGIHRITGKSYDDRYFMKMHDEKGNVVWRNIFTYDPRIPGSGTRDIFGYDHDGIDERGFDRGELIQNEDYTTGGFNQSSSKRVHMHHHRMPDGSYSRYSTEYNLQTGENYYGYPRGTAVSTIVKRRNTINGVERFYFDGRSEFSGGKNNFGGDGLDIDGFDAIDFKQVGNKWYHRFTGSQYNLSGRDRNGRLDPSIEKSERIIEFIEQHPNASNQEIAKACGVRAQELDDKISEGYAHYLLSPGRRFDKTSKWTALTDLKLPDHVYSILEKASPTYKRQVVEIFKQRAHMIITLDKQIEELNTEKSKKVLGRERKNFEDNKVITSSNIQSPTFRDYSEEDDEGR